MSDFGVSGESVTPVAEVPGGGGVGAKSRAVCGNELGHGRESGAGRAVARG
jgi:hypothetical protein